MADAEFSREEAQNGQLPTICMKCGAPATEEIDQDYTTDQVHVVPPAEPLGCLIIGPILGLAKLISWSTAKTMTVRTPLCQKHSKGWFTKASFTVQTITEDRIVLSGVSEEFARAWKQLRIRSRPQGKEVIKIRCRTCQALNEESAKFCSQCGMPM